MRQITLINACFFIYVLLTAKPLARSGYAHDFLTLYSSKLDKVISCNKNSCTQISLRSTAKPQKPASILNVFNKTNFIFLADIFSNAQSVQVHLFRLPIYRYFKTGLSPPFIS